MVTAGKGAHIACRVGSCAALQLGQRQLCLSATHTVLPHTQHQPPLQTAPSLAVASHGSLGAAWNFSDKKNGHQEASNQWFAAGLGATALGGSAWRWPLQNGLSDFPHLWQSKRPPRWLAVGLQHFVCFPGSRSQEQTWLCGSAAHGEINTFYLAARVQLAALYTLLLATRPKQLAEGVRAFWADNQLYTVQ